MEPASGPASLWHVAGQDAAPQVPAPKQMVALVVQYFGGGYQGLQINPGCNSIEKVLHDAICEAGGIGVSDKGLFQQLNWSRAARTDKCVSAAANVIAFRMRNNGNMIDKINSHLPADIRVLAWTRVTGGFQARAGCSERLYEYLMFVFLSKPASSLSTYVMAEGELSELNHLLGKYVGTHSYHNFTLHCKELKCGRHVKQCECVELFQQDGVQWARINIRGQSFMRWQIRMMIGLVSLIMRGVVPEIIMESAFDTAKSVAIPPAPGLGLLLDRCFFARYHKVIKGVPDRAQLDMDRFEPEILRFKTEVIYPQLFKEEKEKQVYAEWLSSSQQHTMAVLDRVLSQSGGKADDESDGSDGGYDDGEEEGEGQGRGRAKGKGKRKWQGGQQGRRKAQAQGKRMKQAEDERSRTREEENKSGAGEENKSGAGEENKSGAGEESKSGAGEENKSAGRSPRLSPAKTADSAAAQAAPDGALHPQGVAKPSPERGSDHTA